MLWVERIIPAYQSNLAPIYSEWPVSKGKELPIILAYFKALKTGFVAT